MWKDFILCFAIACSTVPAGAITIEANLADGMVDVNGAAVNQADPTIRPGTGGNDVRGQAGIVFFALPFLPSSESIADATLALHFSGFDGTPEFNLDLFGLGVRSTATILASDYYAGPSSNGGGTLLQDDFLTPNFTPGRFQIDISDFLESLYDANGSPLDNFLAVRVNPDMPLPALSLPLRGYILATADNATAELRPSLSITVAEPSSLALMGFAALSFHRIVARRRRR